MRAGLEGRPLRYTRARTMYRGLQAWFLVDLLLDWVRYEQQVAVDDCFSNVDDLAPRLLGMLPEQIESLVTVDGMTGHQDSFCLLDQGTASKCALKAVIFREALQRDVDCALQFLGRSVDDVREDPSPGRLVDVRRITCGEQRDHRAKGFANDLRDQVQRVLGAQAEPDECDVRPLSGRHGADLLDIDLARDHVVPKLRDHVREKLEPVATLVCDQNT